MKAALERPGPAFHRYRYICPVCCIAPISNRKSGHNPIEQSRLTIYPTIEQKAINAGAACGDRLPAPANLPNRYRLNWRQSGGFLLPVIRKPLYLLG